MSRILNGTYWLVFVAGFSAFGLFFIAHLMQYEVVRHTVIEFGLQFGFVLLVTGLVLERLYKRYLHSEAPRKNLGALLTLVGTLLTIVPVLVIAVGAEFVGIFLTLELRPAIALLAVVGPFLYVVGYSLMDSYPKFQEKRSS